MPKFSAYMKGGDGSVGPPGASIIDGVLANEGMLPVPNQDKYAFLVGTSDPKHLWVWNDQKEGENKWEDQGTTASEIGRVTASASTVAWNVPPSVNTQFSTSSQIDYFNFDFEIPMGRPAGFGEFTATISATSWDAEPAISTSTDGEDWEKNIHYDFILPVGRPAGFGEISVTTQSLSSGTPPWVTITTDEQSPEWAKKFDFEFGIPEGVAAGFSTTQHVSVSTLDTGQDAIVEITTVTSSPETAKEFNFHFGLPRGDALAIYEGIPFTTEDGFYYHWDTTNTTTLVFDRGTVEKLPIYIYNNDNESIAATFKLSASTIEYEADEKFNGTMYLAMPATLQNIEIGTVSSTTYGHEPVVSKSTGSTSTNIILDFIIPEGYPGRETIDSLTTKVESISTQVDNKINQDSIANIFTTTQTYAKDDYVIHNNGLYQFQVAHTPGDWVESQVLPALAVEAGGGGGSYVEGVGADVKFLDSVSTLAIMPSNRTLEPIENSMAIISNGNNHISISTGQYVYVKKDSDDLPTGVPEGLYSASTDIAANETLTTSKLSTINSGGLNDLLNKTNQLNDKINKLEVLVVDCGTISSLPQTFNGSNGAAFANVEDDMVVLQSYFGTPSAATSDWTVSTGTGQLTISGSIASGSSTTLKLYLMKSR